MLYFCDEIINFPKNWLFRSTGGFLPLLSAPTYGTDCCGIDTQIKLHIPVFLDNKDKTFHLYSWPMAKESNGLTQRPMFQFRLEFRKVSQYLVTLLSTPS